MNLRQASFSFIASLLTSLLILLSFPNYNHSFLVWICLIPLLFATYSLRPLLAFLWGMVSGCAAYAFLFSWINTAVSSQVFSIWQGIFSLSFISVYVALYTTGLWAFALAYFGRRMPVLVVPFFAASLWTASEYMRANLLTGFPWGLLGYSQWNFPAISQIAEYTGVFGVSFVIVFFNISIFLFIKTRRSVLLAYACCALLVPLAAGMKLMHRDNKPQEYTINIASIQANIEQKKKWDRHYRDEIKQQLRDVVMSAAANKPDLIVWPETAVPGYLPYDGELSVWVTSLAAKTATYHLIGAPYFNERISEYQYNASFLIDPTGAILGWHTKIHLVPFGEFTPFRFVFPGLSILNELGEFSHGMEPTVLQMGLPGKEDKKVNLGPILCSESFYGSIVRGFPLRGANMLINQTNNAWFLDTAAPQQNLSMSIFRAIENRRVVHTSGNTGITGVIEPSGVVSKIFPQFIAGSMLCSITPYTRITFYTAHGDVLAIACMVASISFIGFYLYNSIRRRRISVNALKNT